MVPKLEDEVYPTDAADVLEGRERKRGQSEQFGAFQEERTG
jgi:hypothetical protein